MKNQKGFGLLEMMITVGILSIVMMGTMQALTHAMLVSQTSDVKAALTSLVTSTAGTAFNDVTCTAAVTKTSQTYGQTLQFDDLKNGVSMPQYYVTITSLTFSNPSLIATGYEGTKIYRGTITMVATSNRQIYGPRTFAPRAVAAVYFKVDPSNKVTGCGPTLPTLPTQPPAEEPKKDDEEFKRGCSNIGGAYSNGNCTFHSQGGKDDDGKKDNDSGCDKQR